MIVILFPISNRKPEPEIEIFHVSTSAIFIAILASWGTWILG